MSAFPAKDTHLYVFDSTYKEITDLLTVDPPLPAWQFEELSPLDSSSRARTHLPTLFESGVLAFTYLHDDSVAGHAAIRAVANAGGNALQQFKLTSPGRLGEFEFSGYLQDAQLPHEKAAHVKGSFNIRVNAPLTDDDPYITDVEIIDANNPTYVTSDVMQIRVTFSEVVFLTDGGVNPAVDLDIDGTPREALYVSGSGTYQWVFEYTIQAGDLALAGAFFIESPLLLNDGDIKDAIGQDLSPLTFTPPDTSTVTVN